MFVLLQMQYSILAQLTELFI